MEAIGGVEQEWARRDRIAPKLCLAASPLRVLSPKSIRLSSTPSASAGRRTGNNQARRLLLPIRWAAPLPRLSAWFPVEEWGVQAAKHPPGVAAGQDSHVSMPIDNHRFYKVNTLLGKRGAKMTSGFPEKFSPEELSPPAHNG